jgi:hypothetical protein
MRNFKRRRQGGEICAGIALSRYPGKGGLPICVGRTIMVVFESHSGRDEAAARAKTFA